MSTPENNNNKSSNTGSSIATLFWLAGYMFTVGVTAKDLLNSNLTDAQTFLFGVITVFLWPIILGLKIGGTF